MTLAPEVQENPDEREVDAANAFDRLVAQYKAADAAACLTGTEDEEEEKETEKKWIARDAERQELLWAIIRRSAPLPRHVDDKLDLLSELVEDQWTDCRVYALIASIRHDVQRRI